MNAGALAIRVAALALPARIRDTVTGDVAEEAARDGRSAAWSAAALLAIALRFHAECYAAAADRVRAATLVGSALVVLWVVPLATRTLFAGADVFVDPVSRTVVELWRASHVTSAIAAGLVAGLAPLLAPHAQAVRGHAALVLATASLVRDGSVLAALALLATVWLAARAGGRTADPPTSSAA